MTRLNQIVAVEKGVKTEAHRSFAQAFRLVQHEGPLTGIARSYEPRDREQGDALPPESVRVQHTVEDVNDEVARVMTRLFDVVATKDFANTKAKASVTLPDGTTLVEDAPVPYLLWLEKIVSELRGYVAALPTLDPSEAWDYNPTTRSYATEPTKSFRTRKELHNHVKAPATDKFPAQVDTFTIDKVIGDWTTTKFSGATTEERRRTLLDRLDEVGRAVKFAREEANSMEITDIKVGEDFFEYLFAD
jgi:hypothetical protein